MPTTLKSRISLALLSALLFGLCLQVNSGAQEQQSTKEQPADKKQQSDKEQPNAKEQLNAKKFNRPVLIRFDGEINPLSEQSFYRKLATAKSRGADLLVVEIDSPGGWVESSLNLAETLRKVDWAHTVAFVPREAISGAAVMSLGCDDIVMAKNALLGDAGEIFRDEHGVFQYVPEKARSYLASRLRVLAQAKGRSPALAEAMCDMNLVVFHVRNTETGAEAFMSEHELSAVANPSPWEKIKPVFATREKHFLTVNGQEAFDVKLAQALVPSREDLQHHYHLTAPFLVLEHTGVDTLVIILNTGLVTGLLLVIGLVALYVEVTHPGTCIGGLIAGLCFAIFFWSRFFGGTAGWLEIILFASGLAFVGVELFVLPGFGVSGITGLLLLVASLVMAGQTFIVPHTERELNTTLTQIGVVSGALIVFVGAASMFSRYLGAIPFAKSLMLELPKQASPETHPSSKAESSEKTLSPARLAVGQQGVADSPLRPAGKAIFDGTYMDVVSDGMFINRGQPVEVVEISGNRVVVREVESA